MRTRDQEHSAQISYGHRQRKRLMEKIEALSRTEHLEVFKILTRFHVPYTQNSNGVFINMSHIQEAALAEMDQFLCFCIENQSNLDKYDQLVNECKYNQDFEPFADDASVGLCEKEDSKNLSAALDQTMEKDWMDLVEETRGEQMLASLTQLLQARQDKGQKKRTQTRYVIAKKKYGRKMQPNAERKFDTGCEEENLEAESYLF